VVQIIGIYWVYLLPQLLSVGYDFYVLITVVRDISVRPLDSGNLVLILWSYMSDFVVVVVDLL
jgi:hypothetical protein